MSRPPSDQQAETTSEVSYSSSSTTTATPEPEPATSLTTIRASPSPLLELFNNLPRFPSLRNEGFARAILLAEYSQGPAVLLTAGHQTENNVRLWGSVLPALGLRHTAICEGILALATLFMCFNQLEQYLSTRPSAQQTITDFDNLTEPVLLQARTHYGKCLNALRESVSVGVETQAEVALACSMLLAPYSIAHTRLHRVRHRLQSQSPSEAEPDRTRILSPPLDFTWMSFVHGMTALTSSLFAQPSLPSSPIMPYFTWLRGDAMLGPLPIPRPDTGSSGLEEHIIFSHRMLLVIVTEGPSALQQLLTKLHLLQSASPRQPEKDIQTCLTAVRSLQILFDDFNQCILAREDQPYHRVHMMWVSRMKVAFFDLLVAGNWMALTVYSHWLVYAILLEGLWHINDLGVGTLREILPTLQESNDYNPAAMAESAFATATGRDLIVWPTRILQIYDAENS